MTEKRNGIEDFFNSFSGPTLFKIGGVVLFLLFATSMFSSASNMLNPFSWFQSSREELIQEIDELRAQVYELELNNEGREQTNWEYVRGDHTRVNTIDSLIKLGR